MRLQRAPAKPASTPPAPKQSVTRSVPAVVKAVGRPETQFIDLGEHLDSTSERDWFAEGAIEDNPVVLFTGPEKSGKSWILADLAVATIAEQKWLGRFPIRRPGPVLVLDGEYGPHEFARRLTRISRGRGLDPRSITRDLLYVYSVGLYLTKESERFISLAKDLQAHRIEPTLIIVDPLRNHLDGDENSAGDVLDAFRCLNGMKIQGECPVIVSHHLNRAGSMSGSRALLGRVDQAFTGSDEDQPWYSCIGRTIRRTDPIAQRWTARIDHEHDDNDSIARTVLTSRFATEAKGTSELSKLARTVFDVLQNGSKTGSSLKAAIKRNYKDVMRALNELQTAGRVTKHGDVWEVSTEAFFDEVVGGSNDTV